MMLYVYITPLVTGIATGMILYLTAAGMSLLISGMGVINFAQGSTYMLGAGVCWAVTSATGNLFAGIIAGTLGVFLLGGVIELMLRPLQGKPFILSLMVTVAVSYLLADFFKNIWGANARTVAVPEFLRGLVYVGEVGIPLYYLFVIVASLVVALIFWIVFQKTKLGMIFRAIITDRDMVEALGVNVTFAHSMMFMIGVALSGFAGALNLPMSGFIATGSNDALASVMPILIIGGLGNISGAFPASICVGIISAIAALFFPKMYSLMPVIFMLICIMVKPEGLFAKKGA